MTAMRRAAICIGSNAVRMLVADQADGMTVNVARFRNDVRPFEGLTDSGFTGESIERVTAAVRDMLERASRLDAARAGIVATSAVRDAANADDLAGRLAASTGLTLCVLTGEEEARLSYLGCAPDDTYGVVDIGGGSTEIAYSFENVVITTSMQIGAVRLAQSIEGLDEKNVSDVRSEMIRSISDRMPRTGMPARWVGVGGTCTTLARISTSGSRQIERCALKLGEVERISDFLHAMPHCERVNVPGLSAKRADIIVPGAWIVSALMRALGVDELTITERGNLDGIMAYQPERYKEMGLK